MSKTVNSLASRASGAAFGGDLELANRLAHVSSTVFGSLLLWQMRASQRARLARMEPHRLDDLGISAADARREAAKPFWQA